MHKTCLKKVGRSIMLAIPPVMPKVLELSTDSEAGTTIDNGCLIIESQKRPHCSLEELLAQCDPHAEMNEEDREWADVPAVGKEILQTDGGEIWLASLGPVADRKQSGKRPVLIISRASFNKLTRLPTAVPVTSGRNFARTADSTASLEEAGTKTTGVIRCDQPRTIGMAARNGKRLEHIPDAVVGEVPARLDATLD